MENAFVNGNVNRTIICSVVFLDIVEYSKKTVAKQLAIKGWFNDLLSQSLHHVKQSDRIILDTGDGAAICFPGDPEDALFVANALKVAIAENDYPELALRIGINLGPVKVVKDINGRPNILGDGINVAQRVMGFSEPNQILVSRSYYEVVSCLSEEYAQLFHYSGVHQDKHVREHELYEVRVAGAEEPKPLPAGPAPRSAALSRAEKEHSQSSFDEAFLAQLSASLANELGPIASLLVKKAAKKARGKSELVQSLADGISAGDQRERFLEAVQQSGPESKGHPVQVKQASVAVSPSTGHSLSAEWLARLEPLVANYIGPMASIIVKRAARKARNKSELIAAVSSAIENEADRSALIAAMEKLPDPSAKG